jgi:hypothetical protein
MDDDMPSLTDSWCLQLLFICYRAHLKHLPGKYNGLLHPGQQEVVQMGVQPKEGLREQKAWSQPEQPCLAMVLQSLPYRETAVAKVQALAAAPATAGVGGWL